jgi:hypothetical protein
MCRLFAKQLPQWLRRMLIVLLLSCAGYPACAATSWLTASERSEDFDALHEFVLTNYCYFCEKATDWTAVKTHYRPLAETATNKSAFIRIVEQALDELYASRHAPG